MASEEDNQHNDVVAIDLPAPAGWSKKFTPKKAGTPQRNEIVFVSPTGEEIKSKRQLEQYLKSHPGGPSASEFDWGTGDTPRRSARLSGKTKAVSAPTSPSPKKKQKQSGTKGAKEKTNSDADEEAAGEKDAAAEETVDAKDAVDVEKKADAEEPPAAVPAEAEESKDATAPVVPDVQVEEPKEAPSVVPDAETEESKEMPSVVPEPKADESKEAVLDAENYEGKEATGAGKEAPDGKAETAATVEEEEEPLLPEPPKTGS